MRSTIPRILSRAAATAVVVALTACGGPQPPQTAVEKPDAAFPNTVEVEGKQVTVDAKPQRIALLSPDVTALTVELVDAERIAVASEIPGRTGTALKAAQVENQLSGPTSLDPEQVLSHDPDLVMVTDRHDQEADVVPILEQAGVPVAVFHTTSWSSIDDVLDQLETIGELTGEQDAAASLRAEKEQQRGTALEGVDASAESPRVLAMMSPGQNPLILGESSLVNSLVTDAGAVSINAEMGVRGALPADPEKIVEADPDVIVVQDVRGKGRERFGSLLGNPALAEVPAIKDERVLYISNTLVGVSSGLASVDGLEQLVEELHTS